MSTLRELQRQLFESWGAEGQTWHDLLSSFFLPRTSETNVWDAERRWLADRGSDYAQVDAMWREYLRSQGFTGTDYDLWAQYVADNDMRIVDTDVNTETWTGDTGDIADETDGARFNGPAGIRFNVPNTKTQVSIINDFADLDLSAYTGIKIDVYIPDLTGFNLVQVLLDSTGGDFSNFMYKDTNFAALTTGIQTITIPFASMTTSGSPTSADITRTRLRTQSLLAGDVVNATLSNLRAYK